MDHAGVLCIWWGLAENSRVSMQAGTKASKGFPSESGRSGDKMSPGFKVPINKFVWEVNASVS